MSKTLDTLYKYSKRYIMTRNTKIVIMSDCHRGAGDNYDNFLKNREIYESALNHYYNKGFTYVELGDGDEMWEVENYEDIVDVHINTFNLLKKFYKSKKLIMVYGNHDMEKKYPAVLKKYFYEHNDKPLLDGLKVYESLVLNYRDNEIFLLHGHQVDYFNGKLWRLSRFLVRTVWKTLEHIGVKDPTSAAKNYLVSSNVEKKLMEWSEENNKIIISGHTHRPIFPKVGQSLYFNDGSCIHPNGITCLEIEDANITLVRWETVGTFENKINIERKVIAGKEAIVNFFK